MGWSDSAGVSVKYVVEGEGTSLVLIHEMGGSRHSWRPFVERLPMGLRALRYDLRGAGDSEKVRAPFTMDDHVTDLEAVLADAEQAGPHVVVGCAAGAGIALRYAEKHPENTLGVVLCSPALSVSAERQKYIADRAALCAAEGMRAVAEDTLSRSYPAVVRRDVAVYENYRGNFMAQDPVGFGLINMAFAHASAFAGSAVLELGSRVQCPCLVLAGKHDGLRPEAEVRKVADRIPGARFAVIDSAHVPGTQAPEELAAFITEFVHQCEAKR